MERWIHQGHWKITPAMLLSHKSLFIVVCYGCSFFLYRMLNEVIFIILNLYKYVVVSIGLAIKELSYVVHVIWVGETHRRLLSTNTVHIRRANRVTVGSFGGFWWQNEWYCRTNILYIVRYHSDFDLRGQTQSTIQHFCVVVDKQHTSQTRYIAIAVTMNVVSAPGLLRGQETGSDWKGKGDGDETVVTTSSWTAVKGSNISATGKMAQDESEPVLYQSMALFVAKNKDDDLLLHHLQHNPALLLTNVRVFASGAPGPSQPRHYRTIPGR